MDLQETWVLTALTRRRPDRRAWVLASIDEAVGSCERWLALKRHRRAWGPKHKEHCDKGGRRPRPDQIASASVEYLAEVHWGNAGAEWAPPARASYSITDVGCGRGGGGDYAAEKNKAAGPGEIPAEALKMLMEPAVAKLASLYTRWHDGSGDMEDVSNAVVVLPFARDMCDIRRNTGWLAGACRASTSTIYICG